MRLFRATRLAVLFATILVTSQLFGAAISWTAIATTVNDTITYPNIAFQWTATASATEQYSAIGTISDSMTVSSPGVTGASFTARATGNGSLSYNVHFPFAENSVSLVINPTMGSAFGKLFSNNDVGTIPFPISAGNTYVMYFVVAGPGSATCSATLSYSLPGTVQRTAYDSASTQGSGLVNAADGPQTIAFSPPQLSPTHGGTFISDLRLNLSPSDSRVTLSLSGANTFVASTTYSKHEYLTNLVTLSGARDLTVEDGPVILATLPSAITYRLAANVTSDYLSLWTDGTSLWGRLFKEPIQLVRLSKTSDALQFSWNSDAGATYQIQYAPNLAVGAVWNPIAEVNASADVTDYVENSVLARLSGGYWRVVKK